MDCVRKDISLEFRKDFSLRRASSRGIGGEFVQQASRLDIRNHAAPPRVRKIIGDPVDQFMARPAKLLGIEIAGPRRLEGVTIGRIHCV